MNSPPWAIQWSISPSQSLRNAIKASQPERPPNIRMDIYLLLAKQPKLISKLTNLRPAKQN